MKSKLREDVLVGYSELVDCLLGLATPVSEIRPYCVDAELAPIIKALCLKRLRDGSLYRWRE